MNDTDDAPVIKEDDVWQCACGENSFLLMRDGTIFCDSCDLIAGPVRVVFCDA